MNLQTERIDNHRAQLTIEIEADQLESAKNQAARKISRSVRIKGFRKGKAPYRLVAQTVGEGTILEEAVETLGGELYKQALQETDILPYGPGAIEDFKIEPAPTFVFSVPLQPEVELNDYAEIRLDFEAPEVSDEEVEHSLQQLRLREIEVLDDALQVTALGNRVSANVESEFVDGEDPETVAVESSAEGVDAADESDDDDADEDEAAETLKEPYIPRKGDTFVKDENAIVILDPNEDPFMDGFVDALIGTELGSDVVFELTIPDDDSDENIRGRRVSFVVTLNQIEAIAIPELDDAFAEKIFMNRGEEIRDLDGLRDTIREDLLRTAIDRANTEYSGLVLEKIVEGAEIDFPQEMLEEHIDELIEEFAGNLKRQNLNLEDYFRLTGSTRESLREQYQERATSSLRRTLALREFAQAQNIEIDDEQIELRLDAVVASYGQSPEIHKLFDSPQMRTNLRNELFMSNINAQLCAIGQGDDPGQTVAELKARMTADVERAKQRSERLQSYVQSAKDDDDPADEAAEDVESQVEETTAVATAENDEADTIEAPTETEDD